VTIKVGPAENTQQFVVPREYLISVSEYFENAFNGTLAETDSKEISLSDVLPTTFSIFHEWLCARKLSDSCGLQYHATIGSMCEKGNELLRVYSFADEYDVPQLRRDATDAYVDMMDQNVLTLSRGNCILAYDLLPESSPMRAAIVDLWSSKWSGTLQPQDNALPSSFVLELAANFAECRWRSFGVCASPRNNLCKYHEHDDEAATEIPNS
jgi:hypothetical protein